MHTIPFSKISLSDLPEVGGKNSSLGEMFNKLSAYVSSKHGAAGLTKVATLELAKKNIRVNAICPGVIRTPMVERAIIPETEPLYTGAIPMGRMGKPEEIADNIIYLCSDAASYVTGHIMIADGGWTAQ